MSLSDLLDSFFQQSQDRRPDFSEDFAGWYRAVGGAAVLGKVSQDYLSKAEAIEVCEHLTTTWFADAQPLWPTVLGHLLCAIHTPLELGNACLETFREAVGSFLLKNDISPWWNTHAIWGVFVSTQENIVLPISAIITKGSEDEVPPMILAGNFRQDNTMAEQLKLAKDLCLPMLKKPTKLQMLFQDIALPFFGFDPNQREHPNEVYRRQGTDPPLFLKRLVRSPLKLLFLIALFSLLNGFLLLRLPLPNSYADAAFLFIAVCMLGSLLSLPWGDIPSLRRLVLALPNVSTPRNKLDRTYIQVFIHGGETRRFEGPSAGLAIFCACAVEIFFNRNSLLPWQQKLRKEIRYFAASAKLLRYGELDRIREVQSKLQAVQGHNKQCRENERQIQTIVFAEQPDDIISAWRRLTERQDGQGELLLEWKVDEPSSCKWERSRNGLTFITFPSTEHFLGFFRRAWKTRWLAGRMFVLGSAMLLLYSILRPPLPPTVIVQIGPKQATPCPTLPSALCVEMQPGEGVLITVNVLSPRLLWPSRWLLYWPLDLSVESSDSVCSDQLPSLYPNRSERSYPLSKEIHKAIQGEEDVYCFMPTLPPNRDSVLIMVDVVDKLNRDDLQIINFILEE